MDESLGKVIAQRRTELGITQRELARGVKISNSTVSKRRIISRYSSG